ncbi:hypothetical protein THRCLA_22746 [Thraustotheca clavata]|uniref:Acyltransferase 3 domain-containing protein n=1 Tax=Thraustotheca clavata TaxID=74557 RepID=A0A1V9YTX3_9STRA|nr:hypothetical protein THRCLA_22746 [Thraustotheca clavata]
MTQGPSIKPQINNSTIEIDQTGEFDYFHKKDEYRPVIDGLRTEAIVLVLIFHAYPELFPSGFISVEVFFAISGYLNSSQGNDTRLICVLGFLFATYSTNLSDFACVLLSTWWTGCLH